MVIEGTVEQPAAPLGHWALIALLCLASLATGCASIGRGFEAALLLADVQAGSGASRLKRTTPDPLREESSFAFRGATVPADVYRPGEQAQGAMVLIHGFTEDGRRDRLLVQFAESLARVGFNVLVPEVEPFRDMDVSAGDAELIRAAFERMSGDPDLAPDGRAGLAAFSFGVGPTLLAAKDPAVADCVAFVIGVGGYYDMPAMLSYMITGYDPLSDTMGPGPPRAQAKWLVLQSHLDHVADPADRHHLERIAERRMHWPEADTSEWSRQLSDEGRSIYRFVTNEDPDAVAELLAELPSGVRDELAAMDLARRDLGRLRAQLLLIHGRDDNVIPFAHSRALAAALPSGQAELFPASGLMHVQVNVGLRGGWQLWRAATAVLRQRDGSGPPCDPVPG